MSAITPTSAIELTRNQAETRNEQKPSRRSLRALDCLNVFLADVQTGVGPFLAVYLAASGWDEQAVGIALTVGGIAGIAAQTPAGAWVDRTRAKRGFIAIAVLLVAVAALALAEWSTFPVVMGSQVIIGAAGCVFIPAVAAMSLGLVGHQKLDRQIGRNQCFNSAGNVLAAVLMGLVGYLIAPRTIFFVAAGLAIPTLLALRQINPTEIDHDLARGGTADKPSASGWKSLLADRRLLIFAPCVVLFHFANAAMLPLLGQMLAKGKPQNSALFMSACVVVTQLVMTIFSPLVGQWANRLGRKPVLLVGFAALPIRGLLYTLTDHPALLVAIQILDGVGVAVFGIVSLLVIADVTRGTGRFNVTQGVIATALGLGAALSQTFAGAITKHFGYNAAFESLAAIAAAGLALLWLKMPETAEREKLGVGVTECGSVAAEP